MTALDFQSVFNPAPRIEQVKLANGASYFVIDDALLDPERLVSFAANQRIHFRDVDFNAYPGVYLMTPELDADLSRFFNQHVRRLFDARRLLQLHCRLSMVTLPGDALRPYQRMCHRDAPVLDPKHSIQASILYLFEAGGFGGTSFYAPARPEAEMQALFFDASTLSSDAFNAKHELQPGYILGSNRYFTCVGSAAAKWNRMIIYDGYMFHSGDIPAPQRLTSNPRDGRLTLNGFFTCRRHLTSPMLR